MTTYKNKNKAKIALFGKSKYLRISKEKFYYRSEDTDIRFDFDENDIEAVPWEQLVEGQDQFIVLIDGYEIDFMSRNPKSSKDIREYYIPEKLQRTFRSGQAKVCIWYPTEALSVSRTLDKVLAEYRLKFGTEIFLVDSNVYNIPDRIDKMGKLGIRYLPVNWFLYSNGAACRDRKARNANFVDSYGQSIENKILNLNGRLQEDRIYTSYILQELGIGINTLTGVLDTPGSEVTFYYSLSNIVDKFNVDQELSNTFYRSLCKIGRKPMLLDIKAGENGAGKACGKEESVFLHLVHETRPFQEETLFFSEKVFRPMIYFRPFILVNVPGSLEYLRDIGFQTFGKWIDESYDKEKDYPTRVTMALREAIRIGRLPEKDLRSMLLDMKPVLEHNFEVLSNVKELKWFGTNLINSILGYKEQVKRRKVLV